MRNTDNLSQRSSARVMPTDLDTVIIKDNTFSYYFSYFCEIIKKMVKFIFGSPVLRWIFYSSSLAAVAYIGFNIFLYAKYVQEEDYEGSSSSDTRIGYCIMAFFVIVLFWIGNLAVTYSYVFSGLSTEGIGSAICLSCYYTILFILSVGVIYMLRDLYSYNIGYFITALILFLFTVNIIALLVAIGYIIACFMFILMILQLLVRFFTLLYYLLCPNKEPKVEPLSVFHYDKNKTKVTECAICLQHYKDNDLICIGKCHTLHIIHMECILIWLITKNTCPTCGKPVELY